MNKEATEILATAIEKDALNHESGKYSKIGLSWDEVYGQLLPIEDIDQPMYGIAFRFWDDWCDAANHNWQYHKPIKSNEWPNLAREIAADLRSGIVSTNPIIIDNFKQKPKQNIIKRIKAWLSRSQ